MATTTITLAEALLLRKELNAKVGGSGKRSTDASLNFIEYLVEKPAIAHLCLDPASRIQSGDCWNRISEFMNRSVLKPKPTQSSYKAHLSIEAGSHRFCLSIGATLKKGDCDE